VEGKASVRISGRSGKPEVREIQTGLSDGLTVEVKDGLALDDAVLEPEKSALAKETK
jgi:hypothetical protein